MDTSPKFTVVVACCQTEPYLPKALDSLSAQTFRDFEAILYVEESTDRSLEICREWATQDPRFKVATGPRSGAVATTRNYGVDHACGAYLVVLDGDDWLAPDAFETLAARIEKDGPFDVLAFAGVSVRDGEEDLSRGTRFSNFGPADETGVFTGKEAILRAGRNGGRMHHQTVLGVYRTAFLRGRGLRQKDGMVMEDFEWTPRVWFAAERFGYVDREFYVYRRRAGSLTTERSGRVAAHVAEHFRSLCSFAETCGASENVRRVWANQWLSILFWFLFHPVTSAKVSDDDRRAALRVAVGGGQTRRFLALAALASRPKRAAVPLLRLAAAGGPILPANFFFRRFYYPLADLRKTR